MYKKDFPLLANNDLVYLDSASTTQKPSHVIDNVDSYIRTSYANIHRGMYSLSEQSELLYDQSKQKVASFLSCEAREIIYGANATHLFNLLIQSLLFSDSIPTGSTVLLGVRDHHASIVPWQILAKRYGITLEFLQLRDDFSFDWDDFDAKYTENVSVVCCSMASNVTGAHYSMQNIAKKLRDDTFFIVDGSQSFPHLSIDVQKIQCDAFVFTAHKVLAYTGLGVMYLAKKHIRPLQPMMGGGGTIQSVTQNGYTMHASGQKFEAGTPNVIAAVSLLYALEYIESIGGIKRVIAYEDELTAYCQKKFRQYSRVKLFGPAYDRVGVFSFSVDEIHALDVSDYFAQASVAIRGGAHCAHPLLHAYEQKALCRMSLYLYNDIQDIDRFFSVLDDLLSTY